MNARVPVFDTNQMLADVTKAWDDDIVGQLTDYIEIPAKSPAFDAGWAKAGYLDLVVERAADWVRAQGVEGLNLEIIRIPGRTPVIFFEVNGTREAP